MKARKLLQKILSGSKNIRFEDFLLLIQAFGFVHKRTRGSHQIFKHPGVADLLSVQPDHDRQAKPYQIRQFLSLVEDYNLSLTDDDDDQGAV